MSGEGERKMKRTYLEEIYLFLEARTEPHVIWRQRVSFATDIAILDTGSVNTNRLPVAK